MTTPHEPSAIKPRSASESATLPPAAVVAESPLIPLPGPGGAVAFPLPQAPSESETPVPTAPAAAAWASVEVPGYEILRELGRGGMGVVYQARHRKLNRLVALKMILAGGHAGAADLTRFQTEAEAIARLHHTNIVQVYEVGEQEGKPFFSLEFCGGGSLEKKLNGTPLPPTEAAALVEILARAMQAAHEQQVIHRDLKPANVLLAEDGTPKITDFGLAKKLDEAGQTASGVVMGTPSYMAPEQAGGKAGAIGTACDVYALGATLYELLTGRPPFRAPTALDTLLQVVSDEPVPPRQLQSKTPRDLETICLKCLHKEASKRYATADALADDLGRFQRGESIAARPVGRLERGWRWCRRNPALATALGAVLLVFATGATLSTVLAVLADHRAAEATRARGEAEQETDNARRSEEKANHSEAAAVAAIKDLEKSNDRLVTSMARSLLGPLGIRPGQWLNDTTLVVPPPHLSHPEIESLWELASSPEERLGVRFVQEALRGPVQTRQLKDRAAYALQAAVRLDDARRRRVEQMLGERLQTRGINPEERLDVALVLAQADIQDSALAGKVVMTLTEAMTKTTDAQALQQMGQDLSAVASRIEAKETQEAAATLSRAMTTAHPLALRALREVLSAVVARMEAKEAAATLSQALTTAANSYHLGPLAEVLSRAAARMEPKAAAAVCGQAAAALSQAINRKYEADEYDPRVQLAQGLLAVAAHMEPKAAAAVCSRAARTLSQAQLTNWRNLETPQQPVQVLSSLTARMEPKEAADVCGQAAAALSKAMKTLPPFRLGPLVQGLGVLVAHMEVKEASAVCGQAAATLVQAITKANGDLGVLQELAPGLPALAAYLEPKEAGETAAIIGQAMTETKDPYALRRLAQGLSAVAARMEPKKAAVTLAQAMKTADPPALEPLAQGLGAVAARMEPKEAGAVCGQAADILIQAASKAADTLSPAMAKRAINLERQGLAQGLSAVVAGMEPKEAAAILIQAITRIHPYSYSSLGPLGRSLSAVAGHMESKEAAAACGQAAAILSQALATTNAPHSLPPMAEGLSAVASRIEAKEAQEAAATLSRAITWPDVSLALKYRADGVSALGARMEPKQAAVVCGQAAANLRQAMTNWVDSPSLQQLAEGLSAVAARMEPKAAAAVCGQAAATLSRAIAKTEDLKELLDLVQGLSAVTARMEAKEAAAVSGQAAAILSRAMTKSIRIPISMGTGKRVELGQLAQALSAVTARMEANEAGEVAANLCQAMAMTTEPPALQELAWALTAVLLREDSSPNGSPRHCLVGAIGTLTSPGAPLLAAALLQPALTTPPPPLPAQMLTDLLKQPFCVGEARRLVLGQLARHYQRPFADQWEFVRFAREQGPHLNFTSPPQRPVQAAPAR